MPINQLPLPISAPDALTSIIDPAFALLPAAMTSDQSHVIELAILLQESNLAHREQVGGPARGLAQFEQGGVRGVLHHRATAVLAAGLCASRGVPATPYGVYASLAGDDVLAAGFARLLLYTDAAPLPGVGDADAAWAYYLRNWRPGRPRHDTWPGHYATAMRAVEAAAGRVA